MQVLPHLILHMSCSNISLHLEKLLIFLLQSKHSHSHPHPFHLKSNCLDGFRIPNAFSINLLPLERCILKNVLDLQSVVRDHKLKRSGYPLSPLRCMGEYHLEIHLRVKQTIIHYLLVKVQQLQNLKILPKTWHPYKYTLKAPIMVNHNLELHTNMCFGLVGKIINYVYALGF